jgi:DGQHR domain-containing protein
MSQISPRATVGLVCRSDIYKGEWVEMASQKGPKAQKATVEVKGEELKQDLKVPALRFVQNGRVFYLATISARDLLKASRPPVWRPGQPMDEEGYQREIEDSRCRRVARYLQRKDAVLPLSILVNVRPKTGNGAGLQFKSDDNGISGTLVIPAGTILWLVDGQHRLGGFNALRLYFGVDKEDFVLPVTLAEGFSSYEEMMQFYTVNSTHKGVRTDLVRRLMVQMARKPEEFDRMRFDRTLWEPRATIIADILGKRPDSPWYGRIKTPNAPKTDKTVVRENTFTNTLKYIFNDAFTRRRSEEQIADLLDRYWKAIRDLMPDAFDKPQDYVLHKSAGLYVWHMVAPHVFERCRLVSDYSQGKMREFLDHLPADTFDPAAWTGTGKFALLGGYKGFNAEAERLIDELPDIEELVKVTA